MDQRRRNIVAGLLVAGTVTAAVVSLLVWSRALVPYVPIVFDSSGFDGYCEVPEWNTEEHQRVIQQVLTSHGITWELHEGRVYIHRWQSRNREILWNCTTKARELETK